MFHLEKGSRNKSLLFLFIIIIIIIIIPQTSVAPVGTALFLPLLNIPRSDFPLRTEIAFLLGKFDITASNLIFSDDLDLHEVKAKTDLKVTLVDHHVLSESMADLEENVMQILDHRPKDGDLPDRWGDVCFDC